MQLRRFFQMGGGLLAGLACAGVFAQTIQDLAGSQYVHRDPAVLQEDGCTITSSIQRRMTIADNGKARLNIQGSASSRSTNGSRAKDRACRFDEGDGEYSNINLSLEFGRGARGSFESTVISGASAGEVNRGSFRVLEGGKLLVLDYSDGTRRAYEATALRVNPAAQAAAPAVEFLLPTRAADLTLSCRPVSLKNYQSQNSGGSSSSFSSSSSTSNSTSSFSCGGAGWENKRVTHNIWMQEKRCDGYPCEITSTHFSWRHGAIDRVTGQSQDQCHVYSCERASAAAPKF